MNARTFSSTMLILLGLCLYLFYKAHTAQSLPRHTIVCTTSIIADTVKKIVGDQRPVISLMGPGIDPHLYRARESDIHKLAQAEIIFYNGLHLEGRMAHILEKMNGYAPTIAVSDGLDPHKLMAPAQFPTNYDPHIWLDVTLWMQVVTYITKIVCSQDPEHTELYTDNARAYSQELQELNRYVQSQVAKLPHAQRILVTAHDAFGYFGKAYGFKVVGLQGMSTQTEAGLHDITDLVTFIVEHKIPALFAESSIPSQAIAAVQQAARARSWAVAVGPTLYTDALGGPGSGAESYSTMIRYNVDAIIGALAKH